MWKITHHSSTFKSMNDSLFKKYIGGLISLAMLLTSGISSANIYVVAHIDAPIDKITKQQAIELFTGRLSYFSEDWPVTVLDQHASANIREDF